MLEWAPNDVFVVPPWKRYAHAAHEPLAHHRAHRTAHEFEFEYRDHQRHALDAALHHHQRICFASLLERRGQTLRILLLILELETVDGHDLRSDFEPALGVEQLIEALARGDALMMAALRAHFEVVFEIGAIKHRFARRALDPEPFRNGRAAFARGALDAWRKELLQPGHRRPPDSKRNDGSPEGRLRRPPPRWAAALGQPCGGRITFMRLFFVPSHRARGGW